MSKPTDRHKMFASSKLPEQDRQVQSNRVGSCSSFDNDDDDATTSDKHCSTSSLEKTAMDSSIRCITRTTTAENCTARPPWDWCDTERMERLVAGLIQRGRAASHSCTISLDELDQIICNVWPCQKLRDDTVTAEPVKTIAFHLLCCALVATTRNTQEPMFRLVEHDSVVSFKIDQQLCSLAQFMQTWKTCPAIPSHITETIAHQLEQQRNKQQHNSTITTNSTVTDQVSLPNSRMTKRSLVEDRVRARAKLQRTDNCVAKSQTMEDLFSYANILWTFARAIQERQNIASLKQRSSHLTKPKNYQGVVILTLADVVERIQSSTLVNNRPTRKMAVASVHELCKMASEWLLLSPHENSTDPNATLWIFHNSNITIDKSWLHNKFGMKEPASGIKPQLIGSDMNPEPISMPEPTSIGVSKEAKPSSKIALLALPPKKKEKPQEARTSTRRFLFPSNNDKNPRRTDDPVPPKRKLQETSNLVAAKKQRQSPLRVNPHLIFSDADYQGGEHLVPNPQDSPRGLKGLFLQMLQGQRI